MDMDKETGHGEMGTESLMLDWADMRQATWRRAADPVAGAGLRKGGGGK